MKNYSYKQNDLAFDVVEKQTNYVIKSFATKEDARNLVKFLNGGGAFNGFTPGFFVGVYL